MIAEFVIHAEVEESEYKDRKDIDKMLQKMLSDMEEVVGKKGLSLDDSDVSTTDWEEEDE